MATNTKTTLHFQFDPALADTALAKTKLPHLAGCQQNGNGRDPEECSSCQRIIENHVLDLPGVEYAAAKFEYEGLTLLYGPMKVNPDRIREAS